MDTLRAAGRTMRLVSVLVLVFGMVLTFGSPGAAASEAEPVTSARLPGATNPLLPDHRAEQEAFDSIRQAPPGVSAAQARLDALRLKQALPTTKTLPGVIGGKGLLVGKDGLAPRRRFRHEQPEL